MSSKKYASPEVIECVENALNGIAAVKDVSASLRDIEKLKIPAPQPFSAKMIAALRENIKVSQAVLAVMLNVKVTTVQKWESGVNEPSGSSLRLLSILKKNGPSAIV